MQSRTTIAVSRSLRGGLILACLLAPRLLSAQEFYSTEGNREGRVSAIFYRDDSVSGERIGTSGWIVDYRDSAFLFDDGNDEAWVDMSSITHVDLFTVSTTELPIMLFAASTWLAGQLLVSSYDVPPEEAFRNESTAFTRYPVQDLAFGSLTVGISTGLLTHLITRSGTEQRESYSIEKGDLSTLSNRLHALLRKRARHFTLRWTAAGQIWQEGERAVEKRQSSGGVAYFRRTSTEGSGGIEYQWPRRIRLGYALSQVVDLGIVVVNNATSPVAGTFGIPHFPYDGKNWDVETTVAGTGYAASVVVRPRGMRFGPEAGLAVGMADMSFYERTTGPDSVTRELNTESVTVSEVVPMAIFNADFFVQVTEGLMFSATVDLLFLPDFTPPPLRGGWSSEPISIPLRSASLGVSLGYRF